MPVLINWLWQACAVTACTAIVLRLRPRLSAATRYQVLWLTVAVLLLLPALRMLSRMTGWTHAGPISAVSSIPATPMATLPGWPVTLILVAWIIWIAIGVIRMILPLGRLWRAKRACKPFPESRLRRLRYWTSIRGTGRPATVVVSTSTRFAAVLGGRAPLIAVAPAVIHELNDEDLDRVLVHEWAHIQRYDDVARFVQLGVRAMAGLHPAIWWIDRRIDVEREAACDDWAVRVTGSVREYAACLTRLAEVGTGARDLALAPGALSPPQLTARVLRLLDSQRTVATRPVATFALAGPALLGVALALGSLELLAVAAPLVASFEERVTSSVPSKSQARLPPAPMNESSSSRRTTRSISGRLRSAVPESALQSIPIVAGPQPPPIRGVGVARTTVALPDSAADPVTTTSTLPEAVPGLTTLPGESAAPPAAGAGQHGGSDGTTVTPWGVAADAGVNLGRGSQKAAVATAGFFTKLSKKIASAF